MQRSTENSTRFVVLSFVLGGGFASAQTILTAPSGETIAYPLDSGLLSNSSDQSRSVWQSTVTVEGAAWLRLYFDQVDLAPGSTLVLSSGLDHKTQHHAARTLVDWRNTSAYFNGDTVLIELIAAAHLTNNRIVLREVAFARPLGGVAGTPCGVCNGDDRVPSEEPWVGRLQPIGCTASMFSASGCFVTAGHCLGAAFVMEFQVPLSLPDGTPQHPGPEDQYPVIESSIDGVFCCVGNDWGYFECGSNTETGLFPIEVQGEYRPIANPVPSVFPVEIEVFGYGISQTGMVSQAQQRSTGSLINADPFPGKGDAVWNHLADTTGGNSGSALLVDGRIIGIASHCLDGCPNFGTLVNRPDFTEARAACPSSSGDCDAQIDVDLDDFAGFPSCMTGPTGGGLPEECGCIDFQLDDHVDLNDVSLFQNGFTGNLCVPPTIVSSPPAQTLCNGWSTTLEVVATSFYTLSYQWLKDGVEIPGATDAVLVIESFAVENEGAYVARVTTMCGTSHSAPALLTPCTAVLFEVDFEADTGWTVQSDPNMVRGQWLRSAPVGTSFGFGFVQPNSDNPFGVGTRCFVTGPFGGMPDANDVDGGPTVLYSPLIDLSQAQSLTLRYAYWFFRGNSDGDDALHVAASNDAGQTWIDVVEHRSITTHWTWQTIDLASLIPPTAQMQLRFTIQDAAGDTTLEALVDDVQFVTAD